MMSVVDQSLLIFDVFILREIKDLKVELRHKVSLWLCLGLSLGWLLTFDRRKSC